MTTDKPSVTQKLVEVPCPVCGSEEYRVHLPGTLGDDLPVFGYKWTPEVSRSYRMVRCKICSHVYASPRLSNIYKHYVDNVDETYIENEPLRTATARVVIDTIQKFVSSGRLLDIGCATGDFLAVAQKHFDVEGLELSNWARKEVERKGLAVYDKVLADIVEEGPCYDVVTMWGVIEHLEYPLLEMKRVHRLMRPNGVVCLWTGDVDSFLARLFGGRWWYVMGQHLQLFGRASLDRLLRDAGFEPVYRGTYPYVTSFGYLGKSLGRYQLFGRIACFFLNLPVIRDWTFTLKLPDEIFDVYRKV